MERNAGRRSNSLANLETELFFNKVASVKESLKKGLEEEKNLAELANPRHTNIKAR
jgi:hypothetical protein